MFYCIECTVLPHTSQMLISIGMRPITHKKVFLFQLQYPIMTLLFLQVFLCFNLSHGSQYVKGFITIYQQMEAKPKPYSIRTVERQQNSVKQQLAVSLLLKMSNHLVCTSKKKSKALYLPSGHFEKSWNYSRRSEIQLKWMVKEEKKNTKWKFRMQKHLFISIMKNVNVKMGCLQQWTKHWEYLKTAKID